MKVVTRMGGGWPGKPTTARGSRRGQRTRNETRVWRPAHARSALSGSLASRMVRADNVGGSTGGPADAEPTTSAAATNAIDRTPHIRRTTAIESRMYGEAREGQALDGRRR